MSRVKTKRTPPKARPRKSIWPLLLAAFGAVLVLLAVWAAVGRGGQRAKAELEVSGAPNITVDQELIDYGDVPLGVPIRTSIRLTNTGDQVLQLKEAPYIEILEGC